MSDLKFSLLLEGIDRATKPFRNVIAEGTNLRTSLGKAATELKGLNNTQKRLDGFQKLKRDTGETSRALEETQREAQRLGREMTETGTKTGALARKQKAAARRVNQLKEKQQAQRRELQGMRGELDKAGLSTRNLGEAQRTLSRRIATANRALQTQQNRLQARNRFRAARGNLGTAAQGAQASAQRLAIGGALVGAGIGGLFGAVNQTADQGDSAAKTADKLGQSIVGLQELRYAAERSGGTVSNLDKSLETLGKRAGEAVQGTGQARLAFEEMGISAETFNRLSSDEQLGLIADKLEGVASQEEKLALANQLFGRSGGDMINMLRGGSTALADLRSQAHATGYVLEEDAARQSEIFKDTLLDTQLTLKGLRNTLGSELMPIFTRSMREFSGWVQENRDQVKAWAERFTKGFENAVPALVQLGQGFVTVTSVMAGAASFVASLVGGFDNLGIALGTLFLAKQAVAFATFATSLWSFGAAAIGLVPTVWSMAGSIIAAGWAIVASPIGLAIVGITAAALGLWYAWEPISGFFQRTWATIKDAFSGGFTGIAGLILSFSPLGLFFRAFSGVLSWFGVDLPSLFSGFGGDLVTGLIDGMREKFSAALQWMAELGGSIRDTFANVLGIRSPSRVFMELGGHVTDGLSQGITGGQARAVSAVRTLGRELPKAAAVAAVAGPLAAVPAAAQGGGSTSIGGDTIHITIQATGQDPNALAETIRQMLEDRDREKQARRRSQLFG